MGRTELRTLNTLTIDSYGAETLTLRKIYHKYLGCSETRRWSKMKISCKDRERKEELLYRIKYKWNILHTRKRRKANCISHILHRNCHLKHVTDEKIEGMIRWGGRRKQLLDDLKETLRLKDETLVALCGELALEDPTGLSQERT
jgi:hypothetical protein